jgi:thiol-disulfide isomerase/thioredoxin
MGKQNNLLKKLKNPGCNAMVLVVLVLVAVGLFHLCKKNNLLGMRENFEDGDINNMVKKPDPKGTEVIFVLFFVEWCPHCKTVKPEWSKLMKLNNTKINGKNVKIQAANAEGSQVEKEAARDNNVEGYPTIKLISQSQVLDYNGTRKAPEMEQFIKDFCNKN